MPVLPTPVPDGVEAEVDVDVDVEVEVEVEAGALAELPFVLLGGVALALLRLLTSCDSTWPKD